MTKYNVSEEYLKLQKKVERDSNTFLSLSSNFPNSEDFKHKSKEIIASFMGMLGMANREIRELYAELESCKNSKYHDAVPEPVSTGVVVNVEEPKTLEESLKSQIIQSAMSKYSLVELWEKLK